MPKLGTRKGGALTPAQRQKYERQLAFVIEHRAKCPGLAMRVINKLGCSNATVYNTLSGVNNAFNTHVIQALYETVCEELGIDHLVGTSIDAHGKSSINEFDQRILEFLATVQTSQKNARDLRAALALTMREYELAYFAAEIDRDTLASMYKLSMSKLSAETRSIIASVIEGPAFDYTVNSILDPNVQLRSREAVLGDPAILALMPEVPGKIAPDPEYVPRAPYVPEAGNTDADYLEWLRTTRPQAYDEERAFRQREAERIAADERDMAGVDGVQE